MTDHEWQIGSDRSVAVMLCPLRPCPWQSPDVRTLGFTQQDEVVRAHLLDTHREQLGTLARMLDAPPHPPATAPLWTAADGDTRAHLLNGDGPGALLLLIEDEHASMTVRLPDEALRRGALAVGRYLIERAGVGPLRADQLRRDLLDLAGTLDEGPVLRP